MQLKWLVFGSDGFIGSQLVDYLVKAEQSVVKSQRVSSFEDAQRMVEEEKPDRIVCALGRTHTKTCASIDGLEAPETWADLCLANHDAPIWIAKAAGKITVLYLGTGCIYTGGSGEYDESDVPNFAGSAYSRVKAMTDAELRAFDNVLVARIRMPVADFQSPRDLLCKLWSYPVICDEGPNSVTVLSDILPVFLALAHDGTTGVFNAVNPGALTHPEILNIFKDEGLFHKHSVVTSPESLHLKAARSRCALSAAKLQRGLAGVSELARQIYSAPKTIPHSTESLKRVASIRASASLTPCLSLTSETSTPPPSTILVTGGLGFIGSHFVVNWLSLHPEDSILDVDCLDQASGSRVDNVRGFGERHQHVWMDLTMPDSSNVLAKIMQEKKVSKVIHFAAKTHVDESFDGELSLKYTSTNVSGTHALLEACRRYGKLDLFLHVSTDEVYGDCDKNEATEASILQPTNPYAASKAAAEMLVKAYTHSLGLPCCIVRLNNVYGPRQHLNKVIPRFCNLAVQKKPLPLHGAGAARRCFIFASDAVQAVNVVIEKGTTGEVYNVGGGYELSIKELAEKIMSLAGLGGGVELVKDRPYNDMRYLLDDSKLRSMGWAPLKNFEEGLAETFCFYAAA